VTVRRNWSPLFDRGTLAEDQVGAPVLGRVSFGAPVSARLAEQALRIKEGYEYH
jgi:hypothetical protein